MPTRGVSKWAIGEPMIEWCDRHGLDATRIVDSPDSFSVSRIKNEAMCSDVQREQTLVHAWVIQDEGHPKPGQEWRSEADGRLEVLETFITDSPPPLNPEWVALFGEDAAWR